MSSARGSFGRAFAACLVAGASAAACEGLRALASEHPFAPVYAAWCMALVVAGSALAGLAAGTLARLAPLLWPLPWLAAAGALQEGWLGAVAFALAGLALAFTARRATPALAPWAAGIGALFELTGSHVTRLGGFFAPGAWTADQLALLQHVLAFAASSLALTWILGRAQIRAAAAPATAVVLTAALLFSARDLAARKPEARSPFAGHASAPAGPSVLLVVLDTVRADHTSAYGYARKTTPELERLLASRPGAVRIERAYANGSWTVPAHASLLSGQLPSVTGADFAGQKEGDSMAVGIAPEVPMLAEGLAQRGWATFGVFANRWLRTAPGFRRGFASFERVEPYAEVQPLGETLRALVVPGLRAGEQTSYPCARLVNERLLARLDEIGSARFFGLVNFMDAHGPHVPMTDVAGTFASWSVLDETPDVLLANPPETNRRLRDRYDEQILHLDRELGRLFDELERRGVLERTWVFVVGDHGEAFGEHGVTDHGTALFDEIVRVPLVVFPPRGAALASPAAAPITQIDLAATIAAIAGVQYDGPGRDLRDGEALRVARLQHGAAPFRSARCGALAGQDSRAVIRGKWKLVEVAGEKQQLFDLDADPGETRDLAQEFPDVARELAAELPERFLHATPVGAAQAPSPGEEKQLHHLGY